jgi:hypothetical protein
VRSIRFGLIIILTIAPEIVMVRLQGDFAKAPEKRFNYKHCFDALYRVRCALFYFILYRFISAPSFLPLPLFVFPVFFFSRARIGSLYSYSISVSLSTSLFPAFMCLLASWFHAWAGDISLHSRAVVWIFLSFFLWGRMVGWLVVQ